MRKGGGGGVMRVLDGGRAVDNGGEMMETEGREPGNKGMRKRIKDIFYVFWKFF